jgi:hypothetical protein
MAEGDRSLADVLRANALTEEQWSDATRYWSARMADDARESAELSVPPRVVLDFSEAFAKAQDALRPLPVLDPRGWAALKRDVDERGPGKALADRQLRLADYSRLVRYWAKRIANDPVARAAVDDEMDAFEDENQGV